MDKWQQKLSIGYFFIALVLLFLLQTYLASPQVETISYSQFKALVKSALLANLSIGEKAIHGEIKPEGVKQALPPERLKVWEGKLKDSKQGVPFVTIRVEDPELITDLERAGSILKAKSSTTGCRRCFPGWCRSSCLCSCGTFFSKEWAPAVA